jgi:aspartate kinase
MTRPETTRLVMKFGGTSMGDLERIRRAARIIAAEAAKGKQIAVVVSAMADTTTATDLPARTSAATIRAARRMRSRSPIEVPPNFITSRSV